MRATVTRQFEGYDPAELTPSLVDVRESDGTPTVQDCATLTFQSGDFTVTDAGAKEAQIALAPTITSIHTWSGNQTFSAQVILKDGTAGSPGAVFTSAFTTGFFSRGGGANVSVSSGGTQYFEFAANFLALVGASNTLIWQDSGGGATKLSLAKDADAVLALKNGSAAQAIRIYGNTTGPAYVSLTHSGTGGHAQIDSTVGDVILGGTATIVRPAVANDNAVSLGAATARWSSGYFGTALVVGTNPATIGEIRWKNNASLYARNAANSANLRVIELDGSNDINIGDANVGAVSVFATFTIADTKNLTFGTVTGTKFGSATTQKMSWWNATPVVQGAAIADASGGATIDAEARTAINTLLARVRTYGLIAT